jgi:transposase
MSETTIEYTVSIDRARIQARRDALAAQMESAKQQYAELEQALNLLQRNIDAMHGGLQELDALLKDDEERTS